MIESLRLTNVKQHRNLTLRFTEGLNVIRGENEAGKTTILKGISYCLFGVKALGSNLDDVVSLGMPKTKLKTTVVLSDIGTVTRSTLGAEIVKSGKVVCSGQKQVTAYIERRLGTPAGASHLLMIANQKQITGIVEGGNASEFIEALAGFDRVDLFVESVQSKFDTGSNAPARYAVETAKSRLAALAVPKPPKGIDQSIEKGKLAELTTKYGNMKEEYTELSEKLLVSVGNDKEKSRITSEISRLKGTISTAQQFIPRVLAIDEDAVSKATEVISSYTSTQTTLSMFEDAEHRLLSLQGFASVWEGDIKSLELEIATEMNANEELLESRTKLQSEIAVLKSNIVTDPVCFNCGSKIQNWEVNNKEIQGKLNELYANLEESAQVISEKRKYLGTLTTLSAANTMVLAQLKEIKLPTENIEINKAVVPIGVKLINKPIPQSKEVFEAAQEVIKETGIKRVENLSAQKEFAARKELISASENKLEELTELLQGIQKEEDLGVLTGKVQELHNSISSTYNTIVTANRSIATELEEYNINLAAFNTDTKAYKVAVDVVDEAINGLKTLDASNSLLKAVRAARVEVVTNIWNSVLGSVSSYFSTMRGKPSVITRNAKGFVCNGTQVRELSGSALDLLGLAFRAGLTKIFLPGLNMQILDEPTAACDERRSNNMMGFISGLGFEQTIVVTHATYDEALADNLIELTSN